MSGNVNMENDNDIELIMNLSSINISNNKINIFTKIKNIVNNENNNDYIENFIDKKINYVYVIELHEGKYYIGQTKTLIHRLIKHKKAKGSFITIKYKWKQLIDIIRCDDKIRPVDVENKVTLEYMNKYEYKKNNDNNNLYNKLPKEDVNLIDENLDNIISKHNKKTKRKEEVIYIYYFDFILDKS